MPVVEGLIVLGLIALVGTFGHRWLKNRQEIRKIKMKIEAAKSAEEAAELLMLDKDMAAEVHKRLGEALKKD
jgi:AmiR/NasT family two-component response regulator